MNCSSSKTLKYYSHLMCELRLSELGRHMADHYCGELGTASVVIQERVRVHQRHRRRHSGLQDSGPLRQRGADRVGAGVGAGHARRPRESQRRLGGGTKLLLDLACQILKVVPRLLKIFII